MKIAVIGGTHGNEPTGIEVIKHLEATSPKFQNEYKTFFGNPKAYELGKRYVDTDLNRAFGKTGSSRGNETERLQALEKEIVGHYDFILDLHTTTSNMGPTVILTHLDEASIRAACWLKENNPELVIIVSSRAGSDCPYTTSMASSGLTVEIGPVANNVVKAELVLLTHKLVTELLNFDFQKTWELSAIECYHTQGIESYPDGKWMVHPDIDGHDFVEVREGDPVFINMEGEIVPHKGETVHPLFINEAAYQENNTAYEYATKTNLADVLESVK